MDGGLGRERIMRNAGVSALGQKLTLSGVIGFVR
jgi:hypothetical protein